MKFRNTYAAKQGISQFSNNNFPHNKNNLGIGTSQNNKMTQGNQNQNVKNVENNCPTCVNNQNKARITQTWDNDCDDSCSILLDNDPDDN